MAFTICISPGHVIPVSTQADTFSDDVTGAFEFRRKLTRVLKRWELVAPGAHESLNELIGFLDLIQGDTAIWFDGADTAEVTTPILIAIGDGTTTDIRLPHRNVSVASTIIYLNGAATNGWQPLASADGIYMHQIRMTSPLGLYAQVRARYRRKVKVVASQSLELERNFRNTSDNKKSAYVAKWVLQETPN